MFWCRCVITAPCRIGQISLDRTVHGLVTMLFYILERPRIVFSDPRLSASAPRLYSGELHEQ